MKKYIALFIGSIVIGVSIGLAKDVEKDAPITQSTSKIDKEKSAQLELDMNEYFTQPGEIVKLHKQVDLNEDGKVEHLVQTIWEESHTHSIEEGTYETKFLIIDGSNGEVWYEYQDYHELGEDTITVQKIDGIYHILYTLNQYTWQCSKMLTYQQGKIVEHKPEVAERCLGKDESLLFKFKDDRFSGRLKIGSEKYAMIKKAYMNNGRLGSYTEHFTLEGDRLMAESRSKFDATTGYYHSLIKLQYKFINNEWTVEEVEYIEVDEVESIDKGCKIQTEDIVERILLTEDNVEEIFNMTLEDAIKAFGTATLDEQDMFFAHTFENCNFKIYFGDGVDSTPTAIRADEAFGLNGRMGPDEVAQTLMTNQQVKVEFISTQDLGRDGYMGYANIKGRGAYIYFEEYDTYTGIMVKRRID